MIEIKVPEMGESITEATISSWLKEVGDVVEMDEALAELETDKTTVEVNAPQAGVLKEIIKGAGENVSVHEIIARVDPDVSAGGSAQKTTEKSEAGGESNKANESSAGESSDKVMPAAKKIMEENNIPVSAVQGSGRNGQILKEDVLKYLENRAAQQETTRPETKGKSSSEEKKEVSLPPRPEVRQADSAEREKMVPMSRLRQTIAKRLVEAQQNAAILTTFNEVDMYNVMELRKKYKEIFKETHQVGLGFMSFFTKAVIQALKTFPAINAEIRDTNIVYKNYYDIGVAVGGPKGLVVPVVRNADHLTLAQIEAEIIHLAMKVKDGSISLDELQGGTFSITNGGIYGSMMSTPILNPPQSGILGMHNIVKRPIVSDDQIVIHPMMYIALSYDHRIVDGKEAVQFLVKVKEAIEDPMRLLLEV